MDALTRLREQLGAAHSVGPFRHCDTIDRVLDDLRNRVSIGSKPYEPEDLIRKAVEIFWETLELRDLKHARLVSFGLGLPVTPDGLALFDDRDRFRLVLDSNSGVGQWASQPRLFRRCYQGLVRSYFSYDPNRSGTSSEAVKNWADLRDFLYDSNSLIKSDISPEWVERAIRYRILFTDSPCAPFAPQLLLGDTSTVDELMDRLGIPEESWFVAQLILSQIHEAISQPDQEFNQMIPRLIAILEPHKLIRDEGLRILLNRYAKQPDPIQNLPLRDASVSWWGNPWLPSKTTQWGGVSQLARTMVSDWLKHEFVEAFFTKLAEDGYGDTRRMEFWLSYVKSMSHVQFALGSHARFSRDKDMVVLREKMEGLITKLDHSDNAFIMRIGDLVAVEFSGSGNAFYGYDVNLADPFDYNQPLTLSVDGRNSLKNSSRVIWLSHKDGIYGWDRWEDMFEATLREKFDIRQGLSLPMSTHDVSGKIRAPNLNVKESVAHEENSPLGLISWAQARLRPYSQRLLEDLARKDGIPIEDNRAKGGSLWVRDLSSDKDRVLALKNWNFKFALGKGWYRERS